MNLKNYIEIKIENNEDLTSSERKFLIQFAKSNYSIYSSATIDKVSKEFYTSTGVINRAFSKIGHKSWSYFRPLIDIQFEKINEGDELRISKSDSDLVKNFANLILKNNSKKIIELAKEIKKTKNIILVSEGYSKYLSSFLKRSLLKNNFNVICSNGTSNLDMLNKSTNYILILVSSSLNNLATLNNTKNLIRKFHIKKNWIIGGSLKANERALEFINIEKSILPSSNISLTQYDKDHPSYSSIVTLSYITQLMSRID